MNHSNPEIEQYLLGNMLLDEPSRATAYGIIVPEDFSVGVHGRIAQRIKDLYVQNKPIDAQIIARDFENDPDLYEVGGYQYITDLSKNVMSVANTEGYAQLVKELAGRRATEALLQDTLRKIGGLKFDESVSSVLSGAAGVLQAAANGNVNKSITYISADQAQTTLEAFDFVQNTLCYGQMSVIYGESNCGKTFFMTDLSIHVATGQPWRGKRVDQGVVVYVSLEGPTGLLKRIVAYKNLNPNADLSKLIIVPSHVNFLDPAGNIGEFVQVLGDIKNKHGEIRMIVVDTLARAISGGDENSSQDMGTLIKHADDIRMVTGAHISFVHHSGKDKLKGARGHSNLRAAIDTEIEVSRPEGAPYSIAKTVKQRDLENGEEYAFTLKRVTLGENQYGEEVTTCVVQEIDEAPVASKEDKTLTANQQFVYDAIVAALDAYGQDGIITHKDSKPTRVLAYDDLYKVLDSRGFKSIVIRDDDEYDQEQVNKKVRDATYTARVSLGKRGLIAFNRNHIWLI